MKPEDLKIRVNALNELSESYCDLLNAVNRTTRELTATRRLWKSGSESRLIKLGLALIVFPEPTPISETVGACLVATGAVQKGIRSRTIYVEDVGKTFQSVFKELLKAKDPRI